MKHLLLTTIAAVVLVGCGPASPKSVSYTAKIPKTTKAPDISVHDAAADGNIKAVKQHIAAGTDVNANRGDGWTPLHSATHRATGEGHKEIVQLLIAKGADVNAKRHIGRAPLHHAANNGHMEVVELLIAKDVDVNAKDDHGWTPLLLATNKEIAELLIANGADVNAKDIDGMTPLGFTTHPDNPNKNKAEIADLLRKHGGKTGEELKAEGKQ